MVIQYSQMHAAFTKVAIFDHLDNMDTEDIDDGIDKEMKKVKPCVLGAMVKFFYDKHLPAMITLKKWISNTQYSEMTLEQTSCILCKDKKLKRAL